MKKLILRLGKAFRRHGPNEFIRLCIVNVRHHIAALFRAKDGTPDDFDRLYGTETAEIREIGSLDIASANVNGAVRYQPSGERNIRELIESLKGELDLSDFVFVDFGSGKGRVLMIAGGYPFPEIIGVEFSPELSEIAAKNISRLPPEITRNNRIRSVCIDASSFEPPQANLVCYFYNPFGLPLITQVAASLATHSSHQGYRVVVIYVEPQHLSAFHLTGRFTTMAETKSSAILISNGPVKTLTSSLPSTGIMR